MNAPPTATMYRIGLCRQDQIKLEMKSYITNIQKYTFLNPNLSWSDAHKIREEPLQTDPMAPDVVKALSEIIP